jgi:phosphopantothenoylcysteine decarboxylase/phosphopantothenate--cysteine ligase
MTEAGGKFVGPATFQSLTARQVFTSMWQAQDYYDPQHLSLSEVADLFLVAPATANLIGKFASGIADDLVSTMMMGRDCPAMLAPTMNKRMWGNPILQRNIQTLRDLDYLFIEPTEGWLACREVGKGRMAEPETIIEAVVQQLKKQPPKASKS